MIRNRYFCSFWIFVFLDRLITFLLVFMLIFLGSCSSLNKQIIESESIIFSTIGNYPFKDYTYSLSLQNFTSKTIFNPTPKKSFLSVSVTPFHETWAVTQHGGMIKAEK